MTRFLSLFCALLLVAACSQRPVEKAETPASEPAPTEAVEANEEAPAGDTAAHLLADRIVVDKSDRVLLLLNGETEIARYTNIRFGDAPEGHKQFEGDERTPEGEYVIEGRNPASRYHLSLKISYPNDRDSAFAKALGRSPGGDIFIHGQPNGYDGPAIARDWTDGCIAVSNAEIEEIWKLVPDGIPITIRP